MADTKNILQQIRALFADEPVVDTKLEDMETTDGAVLFAENVEVGESIFIVQDEDRIPLPVGSYELTDGRVITVEDEGIIASVTEKETETEETTETAEPETDETEMEAAETERIRKIVVDVVNELASQKLSKLGDSVSEQLKTMTDQFADQFDELKTELAKMPKPSKPKANPTGKKVSMPTRQQNMSVPKTTKNRVMNRLYGNY